MDADALIADLDPDQRAAVTATSQLVAVVAGAGSGKTRVLTRRIAHRIAMGDADAGHTLALTFTREAAGELRRRLQRLGIREHVEAGTFHAVMLRVLRQRWADTNQRPRTVSGDRRRLLRDAQKEYGFD
ncbi:MAG: AAA family ATPase, partial [Ilumatobacter sp.]|nr:AAA family ATPase [Ilumatobacter sp.]